MLLLALGYPCHHAFDYSLLHEGQELPRNFSNKNFNGRNLWPSEAGPPLLFKEVIANDGGN
jgi:hypothetical protein